MNRIIFFAEEFRDAEVLNIYGIEFHDCIVVRAVVDGELIHELSEFEDSLIYVPELLRSLEGPGRYLIFTSSCGIAEDGGWDGVVVDHELNLVSWSFDVGEVSYFYKFEKTEYFNEIESIASVIEKSNLRLEPKPTSVVFPESMSGPSSR
jgi:hypothetical protein